MLACYLRVCVLAISNGCQKAIPPPEPYAEMSALLRRDGRSSGHQAFLPSAAYVFSLLLVSPWMKKMSVIVLLYGRASESCKRFISRFLVVLGQGLVLQNAPPHELISLMSSILVACSFLPMFRIKPSVGRTQTPSPVSMPSSFTRMQ